MARRRKRPFIRLVAIGAALLAVAAAALPLFADFSGAKWRFYKAVTAPSSALAPDSLVEVVPDLDVFAHAAPALADVRIIQVEGGQEVPYKLLVERGEQRRSSVAVTMRDLGSVPGQHTSFVADLRQEGALHNEIEIQTPSQNFQRRVVVETSTDGSAWAVVQDKGQIFDFTIRERNFTTRDTRVRYPSSTARYLRVRIVNEAEPPLEVTGAVAFFTQELPPREARLPATIVRREEKAQEKRTALVLDLGSSGFPTNRLTIATTQSNFYRQVTVEGSNDASAWSLVGSGETLYSYNTPRFVGSKLFASYPEATYRYFRLTILNEDNPPLPVDGASASGFLRKVIFPASPESTYRLYYGNGQAHAPSYELERVFPYLVTENLPQASLGPHSTNPEFSEPQAPPKPFTERYPWLLPTVVALASLLVGLFLANLLRQVRKLLPPPPPA